MQNQNNNKKCYINSITETICRISSLNDTFNLRKSTQIDTIRQTIASIDDMLINTYAPLDCSSP